MIGILGGTFDPIHFGHIRPALDLLKLLPFEHIRFIPTGTPRHRVAPVASAEHRWNMLNIITRQQPGFVADDRELRPGGSVYTVDTLASLRADSGDAKPLCWIMGADAFATLDQWHDWQRILDYCHIIITARPGIELPRQGVLAELLMERMVAEREELAANSHGRILAVEVALVDVSASQIREIIARGEQPRYLMPGAVWNYIQRNGLYGCKP